MLTLDVAISTYQPEGMSRVAKMLPPVQEGVRYVVSWQEHRNASIPESILTRGDVEVYRLDVKGLSNNRNNAIDHCKGDIILIADDDLVFESDFAQKIISTFEEDSYLDLATLKVNYLNPKQYPSSECDLKIPLPKNYYVTSFEIAFRRDRIGNLRFYPELGLGASLMHCGEEEFFVVSAIRRGYVCRFINQTIACHPEATTGDKISNPILRGQGFVIRVIYPNTWILRLTLKAYREARTKRTSFFNNTVQLWKGALYSIVKWDKISKIYRW